MEINDKNPKEDRLYFDNIKEIRDSYYVEYHPSPTDGMAHLNLSFICDMSKKEIRSHMIKEIKKWIEKYPILTATSSFDKNDECINITNKFSSILWGWPDEKTEKIRYTFDIDKCPKIENNRKNSEWIKLFKEIGYRTQTQVSIEVEKHMKERILGLKLFRYLFFLWLAVIPFLWELSQMFGPKFLTYIAGIYCVFKFLREFKKTFFPRKEQSENPSKSEKKRLMAHYYYHCEMNPDGFNRLKNENFTREAAERTRTQYQELKNTQNKNKS